MKTENAICKAPFLQHNKYNISSGYYRFFQQPCQKAYILCWKPPFLIVVQQNKQTEDKAKQSTCSQGSYIRVRDKENGQIINL